MFEDWCQSNEDWHQSSFLVRLRTTHSSKVKGGRRWLTEQAIADKYKSADIAKEIVAAKLSCDVMRKSCVRPHPDMRHRADLQLYLCWDESFESEEVDTVVDSLFQQKSSSKDKKRKKRSSSSASSKSSSSSGTESSSSSDSSAKKNKKKKKAKKNKTKKEKTEKADKAEKAEKDSKKEQRDAAKKAEQEKKKEQKEAEKEQKRQDNERKKELRKAENETRSAGTKDTLWNRYVGVDINK